MFPSFSLNLKTIADTFKRSNLQFNYHKLGLDGLKKVRTLS